MKVPKTVEQACGLLIKRVRFETAELTLPDAPLGNDTLRIQEATGLYVESWIVPILKLIRDGDLARLRGWL